MATIDLGSPIPIYHQLETLIREQIEHRARPVDGSYETFIAQFVFDTLA